MTGLLGSHGVRLTADRMRGQRYDQLRKRKGSLLCLFKEPALQRIHYCRGTDQIRSRGEAPI